MNSFVCKDPLVAVEVVEASLDLLVLQDRLVQ